MPKKSDGQQVLSEIIDAMAMEILDDEQDDFAKSDQAGGCTMDALAEQLLLVEGSRYLCERHNFEKSQDFALNYLCRQSEDSFRQLLRTNRGGFDFIQSCIDSHPVFANRSHCDQAPVWLQLAVTLDRLGTYGSGSSLGRCSKIWGIGKGTTDLYTSRVLEAINDLAPTYIVWPDSSNREKMSRRMSRFGFTGCVGFIDGTTIPLAQKPAMDGECYFDRKHRYSINAQVVCDDRRRIIAFLCGWPGSCADSTVYQSMQLCREKHKYFSPGQYLIADSAYPIDRENNTIVPSYKKNSKGTDAEDFNTCVAHVRVVNEHTIGVMKGRWSSLRELRVQLNKNGDLKRALKWVSAYVVLHNMLITFGDTWSEEDPDDADATEDQSASAHIADDDTYAFRRHLKVGVLAKGRARGGILWYRKQLSLSGQT